MNNFISRIQWWLGMVAVLLVVPKANSADEPYRLFDMAAMRDPSTLDVRVLEDWHLVDGPVPTRQKSITIKVGEIFPDQDYRMPVRMVVPAGRKAQGFHLTGGHQSDRLKRDARLGPLEQTLVKGGVGWVQTVVQDLRQSGLEELGRVSEKRFLQSLNPRDKIQYWAWPATLMRAITAAYAEEDHFIPGKIAMSGGSKNGATPSLAIIHDIRMTAVFASVSPIWDSPLRLCDRDAWDDLEDEVGSFKHPFLGGHYGPIFNRAALANGHTWDDLKKFAAQISDSVFITRNLKALRARKVDMLFHPGTHDFVAFDLAWGGSHHPSVPMYLRANSGHGKGRGHSAAEKDEQNKAAFLVHHFFDNTAELLEPPQVQYRIEGDELHVSIHFRKGSKEESGRIWWIHDRPPDGSPGYLSKMIPDDQWSDMVLDPDEGSWSVIIKFNPDAERIDFFSNHRKMIHHQGREYATYLSSPYTRVKLKN